MRATTLLRAAHARTPMIQFIGQRSKLEHSKLSNDSHPLTSEPHAPAPHPAAPQEVVDTFQSFLAKLQSSSKGAKNPSSTPKGQSTSSTSQGATEQTESVYAKGSGKPVDFENYWEAPASLWTTKPLEEKEIEAIMVCSGIARIR